ncbi:MAG: D-alanine--D-alanine ligase [Lactobacillales bacterium]|jgi:D-alanine-D-alanine ligase|nr:D-alanine--D-alanine ligase [Lactobacillales bacterium]
MKKKVAVVMGGISSEREISLLSGKGVLDALTKAGYDAFPVDLTRDLDSFCRILKQEKPDAVFNALHGTYGEDGCIQGVLNILQIPYTHSGIKASAIGMDKELTKKLAADVGIEVAPSKMITPAQIKSGADMPFPYVVKPNNEGSSVGVYIIHTEKEKQDMLPHLTGNHPLLMEEYIPGRELAAMVTDDGPVGVIELVPNEGFYSYENKYTANKTRHLLPAPIPADVYEKAMQQAYLIHKELGCAGTSRSDFRLDDTQGGQRLVFLEINTHPGMTPLSLAPEIARYKGISYEELVSYLVEKAACGN